MAIAEYKTNSATVGSTEYSCVAESTSLATDTTDGIYQVFIDTGNMVAGDQYRFKIYEKITSGGTKREIYAAVLTGAMSDNWVSPSLVLMHGWDVTIQKLTGTDRSFSWSIRQIA